jgi:hypothetical protein
MIPPRRSARTATRDPRPSPSPESASTSPTRSPPSRRRSRSSASRDEYEDSRSLTPDSVDEPTTPRDDSLPLNENDDVNEITSKRSSRKRVRTTRALEADQSPDDLRRPKERQDGRTTAEVEAAKRSRREKSVASQVVDVDVDDNESDLTDYEETSHAPKRTRRALNVVPAIEGEMETPLDHGFKVQQGVGAVPEPKQHAKKVKKPKKRSWCFDFDRTSSISPPDSTSTVPQNTAIPKQSKTPTNAKAARTAEKIGGSAKKSTSKGKAREKTASRVVRSKETGGSFQGAFPLFSRCQLAQPGRHAVIVYDYPLASVQASYTTLPTRNSRFLPVAPVISILQPLSVIRSTCTANSSFVVHSFPLPDADDESSIEQCVVRIEGGKRRKVKGPRFEERAATEDVSEEGDDERRWALSVRGKEAKWAVR